MKRSVVALLLLFMQLFFIGCLSYTRLKSNAPQSPYHVKVHGPEPREKDTVRQKPSRQPPPKGDPNHMPGVILVQFNYGVSLDDAKALLLERNLSAISLQRGDDGLWGTVAVPVGEEKAWIVTLQRLPEIRYAEVEGIAYSQ
jgi:hypothetical protein